MRAEIITNERPITKPRARLIDLAATLPLIIWYVFAVAGLAIQVKAQISKPTDQLGLALSVGTKLASAVYFGLQIVLFLVRRSPVGKAKGWRPRIAAIVGFGSAFLFLALPRVGLPSWLNLVSSLLIIGGTTGSIVAVGRLGRSFSILPQVRAPVMEGPYRFVRHPLYLAEQIAGLGVMLQFQQPWALLVALFSLLTQFPRMHYEEQILAETFPLYRDYAGRTARLVPGIY